MSKFYFGDRLIDSDDVGFQAMAQSFYAAKMRPRCACRQPGSPMYITKIAGSFLLKRMPDSGPEHSPQCASYDPPPELSGLGEVLGTAIKEDAESGTTSLRLDFPLSKTPGRAPPSPTGAEHDSAKADNTKLTLRAMLHFLWDEARLTHWNAGWSGKRNWSAVHKQLMAAAVGKETKGQPLIDVLFVPPPFSLDKKDYLAGQRNGFMSKLSQVQGGLQKLGIVVAEVKVIDGARYGYKIVMKQMPDFQFLLNEDAHTRVRKRFENELALWSAFDGTHLLAIATFEVGPTGLASIKEVSLMLTDERWIPFGDLNEKGLIERLVEEGRHFIKGMRYNMHSSRPLASVEVTDTAPCPTAFFITPSDAGEDYKQALADLTASSNLQYWVWDAVSEMPSIPPKK